MYRYQQLRESSRTDTRKSEKGLEYVRKVSLTQKSVFESQSAQEIVQRRDSCSGRTRLQSSFHGSQAETPHADM